jgi:copper chaperone CopZ
MAVRLVKGVQKVDGNAKDKTITVEFDPNIVSLEGIKAAMARAGYDGEQV